MVELFLVTDVLKGGYEVVVLSLLYGVHKAEAGARVFACSTVLLGAARRRQMLE